MAKQMCCQSPAVNWFQGQEEEQFVLSCTGCGTIWEPAQPESPQAVVTGTEVTDNGHLEIRIRNIEAILAGRYLSREIQDAAADASLQDGYQLAWAELEEKINTTTPSNWSKKRLNAAMRSIGVVQGIYPPSVAGIIAG